MPPRKLHVEHTLPGRARLRLARPRRTHEVAAVAKEIEALERVIGVEVNPETGSIYIRFDPELKVTDVLEDVRTLGYLVEEAFLHRASPQKLPMTRGAAHVHQTLHRANAKLHTATDGLFDLRLLVSASLAALAAVRLVRDFQSIRKAPWYTLLYYAVDSFYKLHEVTEQEAPPARRRRRS